MAFGRKGREERLNVLQNGGQLSGRKAKKLAREQGRGRVIDGKVYNTKGKVIKDFNQGK
ncbi:hypothetical protein AB0L70_33820 [Kribbella sp. NPDC051952]|uniref:hypothetical protein n=1 Tax=Kribbella sp. NPDC051952 TaxID=3154851 RepID=UPI003433E26A